MIGVKDRADNPYVEEFAMAYVEDWLGRELSNFIPKNRQQHGYDREATRIADGVVVMLEIKGQKREHPVELIGHEPVAAQQARQNSLPFWVCVVPGIPENPQLWVVENPLDAGVSNTVTIDITNGRLLADEWCEHDFRVCSPVIRLGSESPAGSGGTP